ncbi:MAG: hypothetical protein ACRENP_04755 [Longimicrobiales bacterium]
MRIASWLVSAAALLVVLEPVAGQTIHTPKLKPATRVARAQEIALARTAAPSAIADHATIWVLGERGYEKAVEGSNGYGCLVQRGTNGQSMIPRCDDASGVDALYPVMFLLEEMRSKSNSVTEYTSAVGDGYRTGRFKAPRQGGLSYMYSVDGFFLTDAGDRIAFTPHVMIYWPNCSVKDLGVSKTEDVPSTHLSLLGLGTPDCHLIINTPPETARKVTADR